MEDGGLEAIPKLEEQVLDISQPAGRRAQVGPADAGAGRAPTITASARARAEVAGVNMVTQGRTAQGVEGVAAGCGAG